jgi:hypothetical protein
MRKIVLLFMVFSISMAFGQNEKMNAVKQNSIAIDCDYFLGYDAFGFCYFIKNDAFRKTKGIENFEYKNVSLGKITKVDFQNPLKIVLFYENFNTVILLDNQLNETQKINFSETETPIVASAVGLASRNSLWVYNSLSQQIGLFDYLKKDYKPISTPLSESLKFYQTDFNTFFWIDAKNHWFLCDIFGKINNIEQLFECNHVQIITNTSLIYKKENQLFYFSLVGKKSSLIDLNQETIKNYSYKDQILSIFTTKEITNYKITLP